MEITIDGKRVTFEAGTKSEMFLLGRLAEALGECESNYTIDTSSAPDGIDLWVNE